MIEHVLAEDPASLERALALLDDLVVVGVDVERADWHRYYRAAALIQIGGEGRVALVDPMLLPDLQPVRDFLATRVCVLHAMDNDLGPLATLDIVPTRLEDTALAAAVLGLPMGLETLLAGLIGVELSADKSAMQRADWEARPMTEQMLAYAAGDVADLPELWAVLHERLQATGRYDWYRQEVDAIAAQPPIEQRRDWLRTRGAGRLDPASRTRLRVLWETREELARATNTAPGRIANDKVLVDLAAKPPTSTAELGRRGVRRQAVREWGRALLDAVTEAAAATPEPSRRSPRPATEADRELVDALRTLRSDKAEELGIDAGILCPSRTLMGAVLTDPATPEELRAALGLLPWQWEQLAADFCAAMGIDGMQDSEDSEGGGGTEDAGMSPQQAGTMQ